MEISISEDGMFKGLCAKVLLPSELRELAQINRNVESMTGLKISLRDPSLFQKIEDVLVGMGKKSALRELQDLECRAAHRLNQSVNSIGIGTTDLEIDEEYASDGSRVTIQRDVVTGARVKLYNYASA